MTSPGAEILPFVDGRFDVVTNIESSQCREPFVALVEQMARDAGDHGPYVERTASDHSYCCTNDAAGARLDAF
jgi:hypothetical protein